MIIQKGILYLISLVINHRPEAPGLLAAASSTTMSKKGTIIKINNGFHNINGNGILLVCELISGKLEEDDLLIFNDGNRIQIKEVEKITSVTALENYSFIIPREFENTIEWIGLYGSELSVERQK